MKKQKMFVEDSVGIAEKVLGQRCRISNQHNKTSIFVRQVKVLEMNEVYEIGKSILVRD